MIEENIETNLTPLMKQYQEIKSNYRDSLLMFRLGDFYELFGDDAIKASPILGVVLTKRHNIPMCGVPFHSINNYLSKLIHAGFKVAICEQLEDPKLVKGIVKRDVVRIITPGTVLEDFILEPKKNNYLTSIKIADIKSILYVGVASVDISTGDFIITQFNDDNNYTKLINELTRISPSEIIFSQEDKEKFFVEKKFFFDNIHFEYLDNWYFEPLSCEEKLKQLYKIKSLDSFGINIDTHSIALAAAGGIIEYINNTQKNFIPKLKNIQFYSIENYMYLDTSCIRNLELTENFYNHTTENTLLYVLDKTITASAGRLIRKWLLKPLLDIKEIVKRQTFVELFFENDFTRNKIREKLKSISDIERIINKISTKTANPKELNSLKESLKTIPEIKNLIIESVHCSHIITKDFDEITQIEELKEVIELIEKSINPEAPIDIKKGNVIKNNFSSELDELKDFVSSSKTWLLKYQEQLKQKTGITSLKIGFTNVFGYYIEVTNSYLNLVPKEFIRKQTLKNAERFITQELKDFENKILSAEEKISQLEIHIYNTVLEQLLKYSQQIYDINEKLSKIDIYANFAEIAKKYNYIKPEINHTNTIELKSCRHPVVEQLLPAGKFIPNDFFLDGVTSQIMIITGPNMAGKSTYIRQIALIVIMAQVGSFVPAKKAIIGIVDRIFARIGASDYLARGLSTFMVEMQETANILHNATNRSLIILDEIGRGTSTYDGISIAWACVEYLVNKKNWKSSNSQELLYAPKTLFATHYFELTELENKFNEIKNYNITVKEFKDEIVFLHKIQRGCSDKSYGIHVAQLAGVPKEIIIRAKELLNHLQQNSNKIDETTKNYFKQLEFSDLNNSNKIDSDKNNIFLQLLEDIKKIDINNITPLEAFNQIIKWKKIIGEKDENIKE